MHSWKQEKTHVVETNFLGGQKEVQHAILAETPARLRNQHVGLA